MKTYPDNGAARPDTTPFRSEISAGAPVRRARPPGSARPPAWFGAPDRLTWGWTEGSPGCGPPGCATGGPSGYSSHIRGALLNETHPIGEPR